MKHKWIPYIVVAVAAAAVGYGLRKSGNNGSDAVRVETIEFPQLVDPAAKRPTSTIMTARARSREVMELPPGERAKIRGRGGLDSASYWNCHLTNGSLWTITEIRFHIAAGQPEGSTRWERNYRENVQIAPREAQRVTFKVTDGQDAETRWEIIGARGLPPQ